MKKRVISAVAFVIAAIGAVVTIVSCKNKKGVNQEGSEMSVSKLKKANEKIAEGVIGGYKKIEDGVVGGYKKIEDGAVGAYKKVEDKFVDKFLKHEGETIGDAKKRLGEEQTARKQAAEGSR